MKPGCYDVLRERWKKDKNDAAEENFEKDHITSFGEGPMKNLADPLLGDDADTHADDVEK